MKIIGKSGDSKFIVEASEYEIANVMGFDYMNEARDKKISVDIGSEIKVSPLWKALSVSRSRMRDITKLSNGLRAQADEVDKINAALAAPIVEVKT